MEDSCFDNSGFQSAFYGGFQGRKLGGLCWSLQLCKCLGMAHGLRKGGVIDEDEEKCASSHERLR